VSTFGLEKVFFELRVEDGVVQTFIGEVPAPVSRSENSALKIDLKIL
jgi:hypothetical protein